MQRSSILSRAGEEMISLNMSLPLSVGNEQKQQKNRVYLKSNISNNLLQELDDDYEQIQGIETKYVDQNGEQVQQSQYQIQYTNKSAQKQNMSLVKKDNNSKNRFIQQPILQLEHDNIHKTPTYSQSPIKSFVKNVSLSASKYQHLNNTNNIDKLFNTQRQKPNGTLLKNYIKSINQYQTQSQQLLRMKQNHKKNLNSKQSYLTNSSRLTQQDFYQLDYTNTGKYKTSEGLYNSKISKQSANFFSNKQNQLHQIQDILSDINSLNNSSQNLKYSSAKIFPKNQINILSSPSKKYKGNKNIFSFNNSKNNLSSTLDKYKTSKLDQLLQGYQLNDYITNSFNSFQNKTLQNQQKQTDQLKMSLSSIVDLKHKLEMRRKQRQQNRKNNKFYQQVKEQIKFGLDFNQNYKAHPQNKSTFFNNQKNDDIIQQIQQVGEEQQLESKQDTQERNRKLNQDEKTQQLVKKFRLYEIKWNFLPIIPLEESEQLNEIKKYPIFSEQQQRIIVQALERVQKYNLTMYSIFSQKYQKKEQTFGLREISRMKKSTSTEKQYKLMSQKEFIQKWNKVYEENDNQTESNNNQTESNNNNKILSSQELQILKLFDFKWYQTIVQNLYNQTLQEIQELYSNNNEHQVKSTIDISSFKQYLTKLTKNNQINHPNQSIRQFIVLNKLKKLKTIFSQPNSTQQQYSFAIIPSIIYKTTTQKQEQIIKNYLKDNFRGGIYFLGKSKEQNICILELYHHKQLQIDQISNQTTKQVRINQNFVIKLKDQQKIQTQNKEINQFVLSISTPNIIQPNHQKALNQIRMNSYYNQIKYQIQEDPKRNQDFNNFKKLKIDYKR